MKPLYRISGAWAFAAYAFVDTICVGMGMGVPIFCILLGLPAGWIIGGRIGPRETDVSRVLKRILLQSAVASSVTFVMMAVLWGRCVVMLRDPAADYVEFGIPMILYEPLASFIGWLVLMILISPVLQFLAILFAAQVSVLYQRRARRVRASGATGAAAERILRITNV